MSLEDDKSFNQQFNNNSEASEYWPNWFKVTSSEEFKATQEVERIIHLAKYGSVPDSGIPIIDALRDMGPCNCLQCWRDEFIS
jgi:hypothetical protein